MTQQAGCRMRLWKALPDLKKKFTTLPTIVLELCQAMGYAHMIVAARKKNLSLKYQDEYLEKQGLKTKGCCKATKNYMPKAN